MTASHWVSVLACIAWLLAAVARAEEEPRIHEVQAGETLWSIAQVTIGDAGLWPVLYRANRDQIKDPSRVYPGQRLRIPELDSAEQEKVRKETVNPGDE